MCFGQLLSTTHTNRTDANTIEVERLDYDRAPVNGPFRQHRIGGRTSTSGQLIARDVAYDADTDSHWIATWSAENVGIAFSHIGFEGWPLVYEFARRGGATAWDGTAVYNDDAKRFTCGYTYFYSNGIGAGFYEYPPEPTSPSMTGAGCSPATLRWNGRDSQGNSVPANDQQIGNEFSTCDVTGMPSGALSVLAVGTGFQNSLIRHPVVPSNCLLLVRDYSLLPLQIGSTHRAQISLPSFLPGGWRVFVQCWHTNAAGTQFLGTRRLEVPVYK